MRNILILLLISHCFFAKGQLRLSKYLDDNGLLNSYSYFKVKNGKPKEIKYYRNRKMTQIQKINKEQLVYNNIFFENNQTNYEVNFKYDDKNNLIKIQRKEFFNLDTIFHESFYARSLDSLFYLSLFRDSHRTILKAIAFEKIDVENKTRNIQFVECKVLFDSVLLKRISNQKEVEKSRYDSIFLRHSYTKITYDKALRPLKIENNNYWQKDNYSYSHSSEELKYKSQNSGKSRVVYGFGDWYEYNFILDIKTNRPIGIDNIPKKVRKLILTIDKKGNWTRRIYYSKYEKRWITQRRKIKYW